MENLSSYFTDISIVTYLVVFLGGVAASFTPCVYPLIPIIIGVIGASGETSRVRGFILSLSYVFGIAITFSILGVFAAATGKLFGELQSSPVGHLIVGNIMILFGLVLLDVIHMPTFLLSKLGAGKVRKGGSIYSVIFMGIASGFVAAPCTAAVLGVLLTFVATTQSIALGFSLLFVFAIGLGTLLIIVGTFTGIVVNMKFLNRWMPVMQKVIAFGMILLGEYYIFRAGFLSI